jgi:hypothetical protein
MQLFAPMAAARPPRQEPHPMISRRACPILRSSVLRVLTLGVASLAQASVAEAGLVQLFTDHDVGYTQTSNAQPTV